MRRLRLVMRWRGLINSEVVPVLSRCEREDKGVPVKSP